MKLCGSPAPACIVNVAAVAICSGRRIGDLGIAPSGQEHKIYVTAPFLTATPMEVMESGFHQLLERAGRRHDSVQCPTGATEQAVRLMRQHADEFNRQMGNDVVPLDWKPAATR